MKHIKTPQELNEKSENMNIDNKLSEEEQQMIQKGKKHWDMEILQKRRGGHVDSKTIKDLIDKVIENTWSQAKSFYENK